jgi:HK97 family phage prohead protease
MTETKLTLTSGTFTIDAARTAAEPSRSITGLAVPWNVATVDSLGTKVMFMPGSLPEDGRPPRLLESHDPAKVRGLVTERVNTSEGMMFTAKLAETAAANDTMALLLMGAYDSVSVGVVPTKFSFNNEGTMIVEEGRWTELSIVAEPAFEQARIEKVAASSPEDDTPDETEETQTPEPEEDSMDNHTPVEAAAPAIIPTVPLYAEPRREFKMPSPGEWIAAAVEGGSRFAELSARIQAAAPDVTTGDLDGVMPTPVQGPIYNNFRGLRPVVDAVSVRAMPQSGKVFIRPVVTTHTSIGTVTQGTTIQSGTFVVDDVQITKAIYGGYVELSEASIDWSSPEVLGALVDDMARIYANQTDDVAADALVAGATNTLNFDDADYGDPAKWAEFVYWAAAEIIKNSNGNLPTHIFVDTNMWQRLGRLSDTSKRPLFPISGPMNAFGTMEPTSYEANAFGLRVVVDRNFAANTLIVGNADGFECWEQQKGLVSIENPSLLARTIAFRGYFAAKMIDASKFIKMAIV